MDRTIPATEVCAGRKHGGVDSCQVKRLTGVPTEDFAGIHNSQGKSDADYQIEGFNKAWHKKSYYGLTGWLSDEKDLLADAYSQGNSS